MHYYLIAGEASGDLHAAALISALRRLDGEARFTYCGGDMMAAAAGCDPVVHYRDMAYRCIITSRPRCGHGSDGALRPYGAWWIRCCAYCPLKKIFTGSAA